MANLPSAHSGLGCPHSVPELWVSAARLPGVSSGQLGIADFCPDQARSLLGILQVYEFWWGHRKAQLTTLVGSQTLCGNCHIHYLRQFPFLQLSCKTSTVICFTGQVKQRLRGLYLCVGHMNTHLALVFIPVYAAFMKCAPLATLQNWG